MNVRNAAVSALAAVCSFLLVGALVTEILSTRIWPSLFVGIPAGVVAGIGTYVATYYLLARRSGDS
ncbi:hypothetical protein [Halorussus halophilus]|uniref:hypothetical protein n=1 Tax=Halorussus halophilus TaxID=2650975 RepID=UPI001301121E|nr:hypothetical protein [Halorussus halophilus]